MQNFLTTLKRIAEGNNKMKVAFVINSLKSRNGADVFLMNLLTAFKKDSTVDFILISLYDLVDDSFKKQIDDNKIPTYYCHKKGKVDILSSFRFRKIIKEFNPDIINMHLSVLVNYRIAFGYKKRKWSLVKTYHSIPGEDLNKINLYLEKKYCRKNLLSFIGISSSISELSLKLFPNSKVATIFNGIPLPEKISDSSDILYDFAIVASLEAVKNHTLLFKAIKAVSLKHPNVRLSVVGEGSKKDEYVQYINQENMINNVDFLGQVSNPGEILEKSRVFVLSSLREGNPISILEAMSYGLPIVAPNVGGIPDIVENNENGYLFEVNNENELIEKLIFILENKKIVEEFSKNNLEKIKQYSIEKTKDEYKSFFEELISNN